MTRNATHRLCMIDPPAFPLSVYGHRPHDLRNAAQPECQGACRDKDRDRALADLVPTATMSPGPSGSWVLYFVLHSPWCKETVFARMMEPTSLDEVFQGAKDAYTAERIAAYEDLASLQQVILGEEPRLTPLEQKIVDGQMDLILANNARLIHDNPLDKVAD